MLRFLRYLLEAVATFVGVMIVLALLLVWRLSTHPVSSDFLTPYIVAGIENIVPDSKVDMKSSQLTWKSAERAIDLHAENLRISDTTGNEIATIPSFDTKISIIGLLFGQFLPKELSIDHPQIRLSHNGAGDFVFGGMSMGQKSANPTGETAEQAVGYAAQHLSAATLLHRLAVTRAVFAVHDDVTNKDWSVDIPEISITRNEYQDLNPTLPHGALDGKMTVEVTQKDSTASLEVTYLYNPITQTHTLSTFFDDVTPAFFVGGHPEMFGFGAASMIDLPLTGKIEARFDKNLAVETVQTEIHGDEGQVLYHDFWPRPRAIKSLDLHAAYDRQKQKLSVTDTKIDFGGPTMRINIDGDASQTPQKDMDFTTQLILDNVPMNELGNLWPAPVVSDPRDWILQNMRNGVFVHAEGDFKGALAWKKLGDMTVTEGTGKIVAQNGDVTYVPGLPPVTGVNAVAVFDLNKMDVQLSGGGIGNIKMRPFSLQITGLSEYDQYIDIPLQVGGPMQEILRLLDNQPLGYAKALGLSPDDVTGKIDGEVHFHFPLLKALAIKDVGLKATAHAAGVTSDKLIKGASIEQGDLDLSLDMNGMSIRGTAALDKIPLQITWQENFDSTSGKVLRHATVSGSIHDDQWKNLGVDEFKGTRGSINLSLEMTKQSKEKVIYVGALDMTPAAVVLDRLDWKKPANLPAILKFTATAVGDRPVAVTDINLRGAQARIEGEATLSPDMSELLSLNLSPFIIGRTDAALRFTQSFGDDGALRFEATGDALDVTGLRGGNDPGKTDPRPKNYVIKVNKLYTNNNSMITNAQGAASRDRDGWLSINLHGLADGDTPLALDLTPQPDGHRSFVIACDDFGKAMKGLGFTDTIKGGKLSVIGQSTPENPRMIDGKVKISDFSIEKLPVLALLLNATSPFGFTDILTDSAAFSRFQGEFRWQGDAITLTKAHAAGSAVGINVDGKIDMNSGDANLQGTLVPFSMVNGFLNYIPIIGDLITGGEDQGVLAVAYEIKGPLAAPKITVNPVSLLTPGFIRNLFFRDDAAED